jgi:hypothetical protein
MPLTPEGSKVTVTDIKISALSNEVIPEPPAEAKADKEHPQITQITQISF